MSAIKRTTCKTAHLGEVHSTCPDCGASWAEAHRLQRHRVSHGFALVRAILADSGDAEAVASALGTNVATVLKARSGGFAKQYPPLA